MGRTELSHDLDQDLGIPQTLISVLTVIPAGGPLVLAALCREQGMLRLLGCLHRQVAPRELPDAPCQWEQAVSGLAGGWEMLLS